MTFVFLGIVVAVVLTFVLNPARWRALSRSARQIADDVRDGSDGNDDDETNS